MSLQLQPPLKSLVKTELQAVIKNEPPEPEIGFDNILDSLDKKIIPDIKKVDIISHVINEDSTKSETLPEDILDTKHSETQDVEKTFIKTDILNEELETDEQFALNLAEDLNDINLKSIKSEYLEETASWEEDKEKPQAIRAPMIVVEPHEYTSLAKYKHVCNHCQHESYRLDNIKIHIKKLHREDIPIFQCPHCLFNTKYKSSLRCHIIRKHQDTKQIKWFKCKFCDMKVKIKDQLTKHMLVHLTDKQIQDKLRLCPVCGKGFKAGFSLKSHMRLVHNNEQKEIIKCQKCDYTTVNRQYLKVHMKRRHMDFGKNQLDTLTKRHEKRHHCDECDYNTDKKQNLNSHKKVHLKLEEIQYVYCYHCSNKFKQKIHLKNHIFRWHFQNKGLVRKHKKSFRYHCEKCDYKTHKQFNFKMHTLIHLNPEDIQFFYCNHCSYKSKRKSTLKIHIWKHVKNEEIPFLCYICDFMTQQRESIAEHIKTHSKVQIKAEIKE